METFGYAEMREWADQSDDPRVTAIWRRLEECRSKTARWCEDASNAKRHIAALRNEVATAQSESRKARERVAELHAEVERLVEEREFWRDHLRVFSPKADGEHVWRIANQWPPLVGPDADAVVHNALEAIRMQPLPAPPAKEE